MQRLIRKTTESLKQPSYPAKIPKIATKLARHRRGCSDSRPYFEIEHWGGIFIDKKHERFEAQCGCMGPHCPYIIHAPWCKIREHRTHNGPCAMQRVGNKMPLGFLVAWLRDGCFWETHKQHLEARLLISRDDRQAARTWLQGQMHLAELLEQERISSIGTAGYDADGRVEEPLLIS